MQDVYRWYYERAKLAYASRQNDLTAVTPASLMPLSGAVGFGGAGRPGAQDGARARALYARTPGLSAHLRRGRHEAERYAAAYQDAYLRFASFWPGIIEGLWNNRELAKLWEDA